LEALSRPLPPGVGRGAGVGNIRDARDVDRG
jgi:hypothetical protein